MQKARKNAQTVSAKRQPAHVSRFRFRSFSTPNERRPKAKIRARNKKSPARTAKPDRAEILPDKNEKLADIPQKPENGGRKKQKIERKFFLRLAMPQSHHEQKRVKRDADRKAQRLTSDAALSVFIIKIKARNFCVRNRVLKKKRRKLWKTKN